MAEALTTQGQTAQLLTRQVLTAQLLTAQLLTAQLLTAQLLTAQVLTTQASDAVGLWGGAKGNRTPNPCLAKAVLCQLSYGPDAGLRPDRAQ